jgi:hypothetical protein
MITEGQGLVRTVSALAPASTNRKISIYGDEDGTGAGQEQRTARERVEVGGSREEKGRSRRFVSHEVVESVVDYSRRTGDRLERQRSRGVLQ